MALLTVKREDGTYCCLASVYNEQGQGPSLIAIQNLDVDELQCIA